MLHQPYVREVADARIAVLMVHGILGSPRHFDFLMPYIPADWSVYNIVLDGHGGTVRDFARTGRKKWEAQVTREVRTVCGRYDRVVVVAHSMGCMLSMNAIVKQGLEDKIAAMFFLGAALRPKCGWPIVRMAFRMLFCKPDPDDPCERAARMRCGTALHRRLWAYLGWIPRFLELFSLAAYTSRRVPDYKLPITVLQSWHDEVVGRGSIKPFLKNPHVKASFLPMSSHFYYTPEDERTIRLSFNRVLADVQKKTKIIASVIDKPKIF